MPRRAFSIWQAKRGEDGHRSPRKKESSNRITFKQKKKEGERKRKKKKKKKKGRLEGLGQHRRSESKPGLFLSYNLHTFPADEMTLRNEDKGPFYQV